MNTTISDNFEITLAPVCSVKPYFMLENGIFSDLDRLLLKVPKPSQITIEACKDETLRYHDFYQKCFTSKGINAKILYDAQRVTAPVTPDMLLSGFKENLVGDIGLLNRESYKNISPSLVEGNASDAWIHNEARVSPLAAIDTTNGPVVIDRNARVSPFCILNGPLYIGPDSTLDRVMMTNSRAGRHCRLGGEISDSLIGNYTNKHHEGFLGHSIVGDWVNLGALTTTSDLKNNYGVISLQYEDKIYPTGRIKLGSIIGDFVKTGIGCMLNTGTIINTGALLYQGFPAQKYYPRFFWGGGKPAKYHLNRFLADLEKIMARRSQSPDTFLTDQIGHLYNK